MASEVTMSGNTQTMSQKWSSGQGSDNRNRDMSPRTNTAHDSKERR